MNIKLMQLQKHGDERGALIALEEVRNVPFAVKRVYYLFDTQQGVRRGFHAHRVARQMAVVVRGSCRFLLDDGREQIEMLLEHPAQGLLIEPMIWHEMYDFSPDCVLLVLADDYYNEQDYIRDRVIFQQLANDAAG
ncbi:sugar 3,4-ketoisomerase [Chitiniphilus eburneus]|uniref:WxcM-like domain-containing protein n=1 Tax=Chitiniphilus eburneus TaxID=2571148 RepID=A0A4U0QDU0_9NEIS|nr:FdtA/QdtA family cupin domain-containing protein [Chitiniphilus eburneus]TJZ74044.1 WxcM-like domain-containing protein [Chitiniphilus eburneus]